MMIPFCASARRATHLKVAVAATLLASSGYAQSFDNSDASDQTHNRVEPVDMGINIAPVADWSSEWVFTNAARSSRPWIPQRPYSSSPWDTGETIETDRWGYPELGENQAAGTLMFRGIDGNYPAGTYVVTYEGEGDIVIGMDGQVVNQSPGRIEFVVDTPTSSGIYLQIARTNPDNPIHELEVKMPGFADNNHEFHEKFIERLTPFSTIRFMEWQLTNNSNVESWPGRTVSRSVRQIGEGGVAIEVMVRLCNQLDADPWFCMPHKADDDYVRRFAERVLAKLEPERNVYVEYSNEVWNPQFMQFHWVEAKARLNGVFQPHQYADEAKRDWAIWKDVFEGQEHRIIRVAAGQHRNPWIADQIMERLQGDVDALSCAGYFAARQSDERNFGPHTTADDVVESCIKEVTENSIPFLARHKAIIDRWSAHTGKPIDFVAYEGGQHLTAYGNGNLPYLQAYYDAQTHPGMGKAYADLFEGWKALGGDTFMAFTSVGTNTRNGSWGHLEYQDQPISESVKYTALLDAITGTRSKHADYDAGFGNDGEGRGTGTNSGGGFTNTGPSVSPQFEPWLEVPEMEPVLKEVLGTTRRR